MACERVGLAGGKLTYLEAPDRGGTDTITALTKADNGPTGIAGVPAVDSAALMKTQTCVFRVYGKSAMLDLIGDTANNCVTRAWSTAPVSLT